MNQIAGSIEQEHSVVVNGGSGVLIQSMNRPEFIGDQFV